MWHCYVPSLSPVRCYGYRVQRSVRTEARSALQSEQPAPRSVREGARTAVEDWDDGLFAYELGSAEQDLVKSDRDARGVPRGVVIDPTFDWGNDAPPDIPFHKSVFYEVHVKGATTRHPDVPPEHPRHATPASRSEPMIRYLDGARRHRRRAACRSTASSTTSISSTEGLRNYWGYNSIAFFAPDVRYRTVDIAGSGVRRVQADGEDACTRAGIEVILDVVYNHTAEGNHLGPTLSFKGIDNPTYYRLVADSPRHYFDYTGTGNTLNVRHPQTLQLIMDSLRYWITEMHVDGFRFDLASTLARSLHEVDQLSSFFTIIHQDPVISRVKLIAEPWDVGEGGYQVGNFPTGWAEWNGKYRDAIRSFWRGLGRDAGELGYRLTGSSDLYASNGRAPFASVNFVIAHDGFTLADLVSLQRQAQRGERRGQPRRHRRQQLVELRRGGPDRRPEGHRRLRARQMRNFLATLLLSQGTPMICGGDEIGRTQGGNNNAYCQDNEISWYDWNLDEERKSLLEFTKRLIALRRDHPALHRAKFFKGRRIRGTDVRDIMWYRHDGAEMTRRGLEQPGHGEPSASSSPVRGSTTSTTRATRRRRRLLPRVQRLGEPDAVLLAARHVARGQVAAARRHRQRRRERARRTGRARPSSPRDR